MILPLSPLWLLFLLLCAVALRGLYFLGLRIAKERSMSIDALRKIQEKREAANRLTKIAAFGFALLLVGYKFGYGDRDHELASNIKTRTNLEVKAINPAGNLDLLEENGKTMHYNPCPDSRPPWTVGMRLKEVRFEQKTGCKRLEYFSEYADASGKIQIGEVANERGKTESR